MEPWIFNGDDISMALPRLREHIEHVSPVIVEHRRYRGASAPFQFICDDVDTLSAYVREQARPGDSFYFWSYEACCRDDNYLVCGKVADSQGKTPIGGPY